MATPIVSVCLITYNHELYIRQAIESVLMQNVNFPWEIIIADDASTDCTQKIIREYHEKFPKLILPILREINVGGGQNFVDLINAATGKYIAYLEGDDYWTDELKLQKQFDYMESHPDFSMCYHKVNWHFMYESKEWKNIPKESNINDLPFSTIENILEDGWSIRSSSMFFRALKLPIGFEKLYIGDYPLHILLAHKGKIGFINESMGTYRIHKNGLSETQLLVYDITRRIKNHKSEIHLLNYLNQQTNFRYDKLFKKKLFNEIYSFNHFLFKKNKIFFLKHFILLFFKFNTIFLIKGLIMKINGNLIKKNVFK